MAKIRSFRCRATEGTSHPTEVDATRAIIGSGPEALVQISTYGSDSRQSHLKVSQTVQIDESIAAEISDVLTDAFGSRVTRQR